MSVCHLFFLPKHAGMWLGGFLLSVLLWDTMVLSLYIVYSIFQIKVHACISFLLAHIFLLLPNEDLQDVFYVYWAQVSCLYECFSFLGKSNTADFDIDHWTLIQQLGLCALYLANTTVDVYVKEMTNVAIVVVVRFLKPFLAAD